MSHRARIRCPSCRSVTPVFVVWSAGGRCPGCSHELVPREPARELVVAPVTVTVPVGVVARARATAPGAWRRTSP